MTRQEARIKIVEAANKHRRKLDLVPTPYRMRHIQQCVAVCRANGLVRPGVLVAAGFNVLGPRFRPGRTL